MLLGFPDRIRIAGRRRAVSVLAAAFVLGWASAGAAHAASRQAELDQDQRAGEEESSEEEEHAELPVLSETVVVTASRAESPLLTAPAAIAVRTEEELAAEAARTFADLFEGVPGISIQG
ncbi:MAG: hypothetical protein F4Y20_12620, partial [Acidobacteria bacterium]|nr:hypothetical protein [Acidobacteriota bacterium]